MKNNLKEYQRLSQYGLEIKINKYYNHKFIFIFIFILVFSYLYNQEQNNIYVLDNIFNNEIKKEDQKNILLENYFFIIDSNNLENINSHMYGFSVNENGILTDNYYKIKGEYENPGPLGAYIMIHKIGNEIIINQDFYGSFGLYIYENKDDNYFIFSNSFLLLEEYLVGKKNLSLNKDFADNFIIENLCTYSMEETLIREINVIPANAFIVINLDKKIYKLHYIDYKENTIPLDSEEGLKIIDKWVDKWGYIFRSIKSQTNHISSDLSGGLDTRTLLSILLNSGIDMNDILVNSITDKKHDHQVDFEIASNISNYYGFKLNNLTFNNSGIIWSFKDTLFKSLYLKLGFHKEFHFNNKFYNIPRFGFTGHGGESLRRTPCAPIEEYIDHISYRDILGHAVEFYNSSKRLLNRSISILKNLKNFSNDYDISFLLFSKTQGRNHFGRGALEAFMTNYYAIQPLMDPEIKQIKFDVNKNTCYDLIIYIYVRFAPDLLRFSVQGNRSFSSESIKNAEILNSRMNPYKIKTNYNKFFYIDKNRTSPVFPSKDNTNIYQYLKEIFNSSKYVQTLNKLYDINVYNWAEKYSRQTNYYPLRHHFALLAIAMSLDYISLNDKYMEILKNESDFKKLNIMKGVFSSILF